MTTLELNPIPAAEPAPQPTKSTPPAGATVVDIVRNGIANGADIATMTGLYLKLRGAKKDLDEQAKAKMRPLNDSMAMIENYFLEKMNDLQVDSLKNPAGTPYKSEKVSITVADNQTFVGYVLGRALADLPVTEDAKEKIKTVMIESGQLALIDARAAKSAIEALMEETHELPPGLNHRVEATVNVRAS